MSTILSVRQAPAGAYAYDTLSVEWTSTGRAGLWQKAVRASREEGLFLGLLGFDPMTRSGLHQHLAPAFSLLLDGTLHDYDGPVTEGMMGINLAGATHDAIAYNRVVLASRLEGPVLYPPEEGAGGRVHFGAREGGFRNPAPEEPPDVVVALDQLPRRATTLPGVSRRMVYDRRAIGEDRRLVQLSLLPGARIPAHRVPAGMEWFVSGGDVRFGATAATGGGFVIVEQGAEGEVTSRFGAQFLAWADGPVEWLDGAERPDPYGF